jgi:hypothetical protein
MSGYDIWRHAVQGATREDAQNIDPRFEAAMSAVYAAAPEDIRGQLGMMSAYRSPERQAQLWQEALAKYGSPEAARKWVAPPGRSNHNHGLAIDMKYGSDAARDWFHANAPQYGLALPLNNEPWHVELAGIRDGSKGRGNTPGRAGLADSVGQPGGLAMGVPVAEKGLNEPTMGDRMDRASRLFEIAATLLA